MIVCCITVLAFAYGLYFLNQTPEPALSDSSEQQTTQETSPQAALPPLPEEKWEYVKTLPEREVEVIAKEEQLSAVPYIMQCGAYKSSAQAEERKMDIAFQGINSQIRRKEGSSWYRVVLGPYERKRQAERDKYKLQKAKIEPCAIWKDNGN